jgi:hypothetical protein
MRRCRRTPRPQRSHGEQNNRHRATSSRQPRIWARRLHARADRTDPLRGQRSLEETRRRTGTAASRGAVIELEQGRISRPWPPDATTSRWRSWPNPGLTRGSARSGQSSTNGKIPGCAYGTSGPGTQSWGRQRPPRPGCLIPCHPVSPPGRAEPCFDCTTYYSIRNAKALSPTGKGPLTCGNW